MGGQMADDKRELSSDMLRTFQGGHNTGPEMPPAKQEGPRAADESMASMPDVPPGVSEEDMFWLEAGTRDPETDALYEGPNKPILCKHCGGPQSLAVHSAFLSGVGTPDHEFEPEEE